MNSTIFTSFQVVQQEIFIPFLLRILMQVANGMTIGENLHSHEVAVIFLVFAVGSHVSEDSDDQALGEKYRWLACAAMSLNPLIKEATSTTLQALFVMVQYFSCVDSPSCERRWLLSGVMYRLACSVSWKVSSHPYTKLTLSRYIQKIGLRKNLNICHRKHYPNQILYRARSSTMEAKHRGDAT